MATNKKALGKGLGAIISTTTSPVETIEKEIIEETERTASERVVYLPIDKILPNPNQPREVFNEGKIENLAISIESVGLIQPILVRAERDIYYIIAGERRYRACKLAGLTEIKAIVTETTEEENFAMALVENIQRVNLNPIEEAKSYKMLRDRFQLKQDEISKRVGRERATVANSIRLLTLPYEIQQSLIDGLISSGHAKLLLSIKDKDEQFKMYKEVLDKNLSVKALSLLLKEKKKKLEEVEGDKPVKKKNPHIKKLEEELQSQLATKVEIKDVGNKGKIEISYYSLDDFDRLVDLLK